MLILTEKPSVAKSFAAALGVSMAGAKDGFCENSDYCITWAFGHLLENPYPDYYDPKWKKWSLADLPIIPEKFAFVEKDDAGAKKQLATIKKCFQNHRGETFLLATDAEREGEVIGAEILNHVGFSDWSSAKRFWVSEALTPEVVRKGIADAKPLSNYESYKKAGFARSEADWLVGMNFSRAIGCQTNLPGVSFGRVQTCLLGAIYACERDIKNFTPQPYREVFAETDGGFSLQLKDESGETKFSPESDFLKNALQGLREGGEIEIADVKKTDGVENPPQLYNLTGLQKAASSKLHFSADKTLEIAQRLYEERKCLSYPRTPSVVLGDENVDLFREKYELLKAAYPDKAAGVDESAIDKGNKRVFNTAKLTDHHALIPLARIPDDASGDEKSIYELVLERFFTCVKKPCRFQRTQVEAKCGAYDFFASGKAVLDAGFKTGFQDEAEKPDGDGEVVETQFPSDIASGQKFKITKVNAAEKMTKPKKSYTESSILSLMENPKNEDGGGKLAGLGTPATRAEIIKTLFTKEYVRREKQNIVLTEKGEKLMGEILKNGTLKNFIAVATTTDWEKMLDENPDEFLQKITALVRDETPRLKLSRLADGAFERKAVGKCPKCGGDVVENQKAFGCSNWREKGCDFKIWKEKCGAAISEKDAAALLLGKETAEKTFTKKDGKKFKAKLKLVDFEPKFQFAERRQEWSRSKTRSKDRSQFR